MSYTNKKYQSSLAGIDLLRFLLSLAIVVYHYKMFFYPFTQHSKVPMSKLPLHKVLHPLYNHGAYAVEIFWLISGFIFYRIYANAITTKKVRFKEFSLLRFSRLYPLHFATLIIVAVLQYVYKTKHGAFFAYPTNDVSSFIRHLFFVSNWGNFGMSFNGPVWSVSIEVFVYLLFFAVCALGMLKNRGVFVAVAIAALCYFLRFPQPFHECIYYFFSGCLLCYVYAKVSSKTSLFIIYGCVATLFGMLTMLIETNGRVHDVLRTSAGIAGSSILLLLFIYFFGTLQNERVLQLMKSCGDITYATYLVHFPIMLVLSLLINPQNDVMFQSPILLGLFVILVIVIGTLAYRIYEKPAQAYLRGCWRI